MKIGFLGLIQIVFVLLKALNKIDWSWWIIFIPTYLSVVMLLFFIILVFIFSNKQ